MTGCEKGCCSALQDENTVESKCGQHSDDHNHNHIHSTTCSEGNAGELEHTNTNAECHHSKHGINVHYEEEEKTEITCLAVIKETWTEISLFDANGNVRSFAFKGGDIRQLCFSSHGQDADDLLTPCFDEDGNHGTPDEGCFCGLDEPHLHAHLHDPKTCNHDDDRDDHCKNKNKNMETEIQNLARLTLLPVENYDSANNETTPSTHFKVSASEYMPTQCNSRDFPRHMDCGSAEFVKHPPEPLRVRRMHKVQHDDHVDYLVHNKTTGDLHLEHPCNTCGENDYHGKFRLVGKRKWNSGRDNVHLHFFEASQRHFNLLHLFEPESDRVSVVKRAAATALGGAHHDKIHQATAIADNIHKRSTCCGDGDTKPSCCGDGSCSEGRHQHSEKDCCSKGKKAMAPSCKENKAVNPCCSKDEKATTPCCSKEKKTETSCCSKKQKTATPCCSKEKVENSHSRSNEHNAAIHSCSKEHKVESHSYSKEHNTAPHCCSKEHKEETHCCSEEKKAETHSCSKDHKETTDCCSKGQKVETQCCSKEQKVETRCCSKEQKAETRCCSKGQKAEMNCCSKEENSSSPTILYEVQEGKGGCCSGPSCCNSSDGPEIQPKSDCCASSTMGTKSCCAEKSCCDSRAHESQETTYRTDDTGLDDIVGGKNIVRSSLVCTKICCSSEVKMIESILKPVVGIEKIMVNTTMKRVITDHDVGIITVSDIEKILNDSGFGATILKDGGAVQQRNRKGRSTFYVENICCASEIPAIRKIVVPLEGVSSVMINVTTKNVYVEHDCNIIEAAAICDALNDNRFGASIEHDAAATTGTTSTYVTSIFSLDANESDHNTKENIEDFLKTFKRAEIGSFAVNLNSSKISVVHNPLVLSAKDIVTSLSQKTGLDVKIDKDGRDSMVWNFPSLKEQEEIIQQDSAKLKPAVILSGLFWIVSMLSFIGGNWEYLKYVALLSVVFGLPPIAFKALTTLRRLQFDANCLMFFAALGAVALQEYTEAAAVTFLFALSEWLEVRATTRARNALSAIVQLRPESANLIHPETGEIVVIPVSAVPIGALVSVRTGDKVPCDGIIVEGTSTLDESSLTGESRPVRKTVNDMVSGGTINSGNTQLMVQTTASADDSAVARLIRLVEEAQANRSETEKLVDEFARVYTPFVVFSALLMCTIPWGWGREIGAQWTHNGLVLIVVACPCALIISTPVSYVAGLAATAQRGILIKGGAHLEALGLVKHICFDKTGTLTQGKFQLLHLNIISEAMTRAEVLEYLFLVEERASHPLAQALVEAARREGVNSPRGLYVKDLEVLAGEGVVGLVNNTKIYVGNRRLFERLGLHAELPDFEKNKVYEWESAGGTVGYMSVGNHGIVCSYCVADAVRPEAKDVLETFSKMGIDTIMLTGDNADAANAIGRQVGLEDDKIKSQLLPEEKLKLVSEMKDEQKGRRSILSGLCSSSQLVLMCGDGVNDAPALAIADVGVAMGEGAALAMETADVTLLESRLEKLVYSVQMGRRVIRKIKENVVFSIGVKLLVLGFALAGRASLWGAIASDVGAMILVTLNGMLLLPSKRQSATKENPVSDGDIETGVSNTQEVHPECASFEATKDSDLVISRNDEIVNKGGCCSSGHCCSK